MSADWITSRDRAGRLYAHRPMKQRPQRMLDPELTRFVWTCLKIAGVSILGWLMLYGLFAVFFSL